MKKATGELLAVVQEHNGNVAQAAKTLGLARSTLWHRLNTAGLLGEAQKPNPEASAAVANRRQVEESIETDSTNSGAVVTYCGKKISTEQELLEASGVDMTLFEVDRVVVNTWEVAGKKAKSQWEGVWKTGLLQIKIYLRRKQIQQLGVESLIEKLNTVKYRPPTIKYKKGKAKKKHKRALEISLMDPHYGLRCFKGESDHDWSIGLCESLMMWAIDELLDLAKARGPFEEIVFPVGNDFLHHDNLNHTTTKGTLQPEGLSFQHIYERGLEFTLAMIDRLREVAPVRVIQVAGNHDQVSSLTIGHIVRLAHRLDPNVVVDVSPSPYKFYHYGVNLIGFDHGHHIKPLRLTGLMANECKDIWSQVRYREWHLGDQHRKSGSKPNLFEEQGCGVEYLPSLVPANAWHKLKGFNWQQRGAMGYIWDYDKGPIDRIQANLDSYTGRPLNGGK